MSQPTQRRRRRSVVLAGLLGTTVLAVTAGLSLGGFSAGITNPNNNFSSGTVVLKEAAGATTCFSTGTGTTVTAANTAACTTIDDFGGPINQGPGSAVQHPDAEPDQRRNDQRRHVHGGPGGLHRPLLRPTPRRTSALTRPASAARSTSRSRTTRPARRRASTRLVQAHARRCPRRTPSTDARCLAGTVAGCACGRRVGQVHGEDPDRRRRPPTPTRV